MRATMRAASSGAALRISELVAHHVFGEVAVEVSGTFHILARSTSGSRLLTGRVPQAGHHWPSQETNTLRAPVSSRRVL